jgi:pseudaminic acid synthase
MKNHFFNKDHTLIIAEVSANHGQDLGRALKMIRTAKECGADAVKFQTYTPDTLTIDVDNKYFKIKHPRWGGQTLYQLYRKASTPWEWFPRLKKEADSCGIFLFSTAFDTTSADFLNKLGVTLHKIASFELVDLSLIRYLARSGKPLILSTGMADEEEIREAVSAAQHAGAGEIALLKCVSSYPAKPEEMNLRTIPDMKKRFGLSVGLSDHTMGVGVAVAAVALGARIIEKHFTLSRDIKTPDSFFSLEPIELKALVDGIRVAEKSLGKVSYGLTVEEKKSRIFRRSIFAVKDINKGEVFTKINIRSIRPANGLKPKYIDGIIGKRAKTNIKMGTPITKALL